MEYQIETTGGTEILKLSGELTVQFAGKLRGLLLQVLEKSKDIHIKIENVTDADVSCMQLLCSAHRTASKSEKKLMLDSRTSEVFNRKIQEAGYQRSRGCSVETEKSCLWIGGDFHG